MFFTVELGPAWTFNWCLSASNSLSTIAFSCYAAFKATSRSLLFLITNSNSCFILYNSCLAFCRFDSVSNATSFLLRSRCSVLFKSDSSWDCFLSNSSFFYESSLSVCLPLSTSFLILMTFVESNPSTSRLAYWRSSPSLESRAFSVSEYSSSI